MSKNTEIVTFRGKTSFAKILGDPGLNYAKDGKEWTMDLVIDKETVKKAKGLGISDRVKMKPDYLDGQPYMSFKQRELKASGQPNDPIRVVDIRGNAWDQEKLIGNGSDVDVKFAIVRNPGRKDGVYIRGVRVLNLVPYANRQDFDAIDEDDPFFKNLQDISETVKESEGVDSFDELDDDPF